MDQLEHSHSIHCFIFSTSSPSLPTNCCYYMFCPKIICPVKDKVSRLISRELEIKRTQNSLFSRRDSFILLGKIQVISRYSKYTCNQKVFLFRGDWTVKRNSSNKVEIYLFRSDPEPRLLQNLCTLLTSTHTLLSSYLAS